MKEGVGMLLAELMRIKAEGDYDAIKALVDKYGVHFDPSAARPGGGALRQAERAHLLVRHQFGSDRQVRCGGQGGGGGDHLIRATL